MRVSSRPSPPSGGESRDPDERSDWIPDNPLAHSGFRNDKQHVLHQHSIWFNFLKFPNF